MAGLTTLFRNQVEESEETDKLVDLFRNRVELKKEFAALRNEKYQLQDRVKHYEGAVARVQQQLVHLESLLLDPDWVHNVVAFYQLRRLAVHCEGKLARFAEQLKQQREQRVHGHVVAAWNEERRQQSDAVQKKIGEHRMTLQLLEDQLQSERHRLSTMNGVARLFRGRSLGADIDDIEARIAVGQQREQEMLHELEGIDKMAPPDHEGLDIGAKRSINFMILAYAQQLFLHYEVDDLARLAKDASEKSVGAINYGSKDDCDDILVRLARRREEVEQASDFAEVLKKRAKLISEHAMFRDDNDAVPVPGTVATVFVIDSNGVVTSRDANLLGDNYFGVSKVLSR